MAELTSYQITTGMEIMGKLFFHLTYDKEILISKHNKQNQSANLCSYCYLLSDISPKKNYLLDLGLEWDPRI